MAAVRQLPEFRDYNVKKAIIHFVLGDYQYEVEVNDDEINDELQKLDAVAKNINGDKKFPKVSNDCETCSYRIFCKKIVE